jgi:hypothetical protein
MDDPGVRSFVRIICLFFIILSLGAAVYFFFAFHKRVEAGTLGRVDNIGLMAERQNGILFGFGAAIFGLLFSMLAREPRA